VWSFGCKSWRTFWWIQLFTLLSVKKAVNGLHLKENMPHDNIGLIYLYCLVTRI
jgi:hypothetical protein